MCPLRVEELLPEPGHPSEETPSCHSHSFCPAHSCAHSTGVNVDGSVSPQLKVSSCIACRKEEEMGSSLIL